MSSCYDVIVVGAGLGGLSAGTELALAGRRVLVCEQGRSPGGLCTSYRRGGFVVEPTLQWLNLCEPGSWVDAALRAFGVRDEIDFIPLQSWLRLLGPGYDVTLGRDRREAEEQLCAAFPAERRVIGRLLKDASLFAALGPPEGGFGPVSLARRLAYLARVTPALPVVARYRSLTVGQATATLFRHPGLRALVFSLVPRPEAGFLATLALLSLMPAWLPRGGARVLAEALVRAFGRAGGDLALATPVARIAVAGGRVTGVVTADGRHHPARVVVSAADALETAEDLLPPGVWPEADLARLKSRPVAPGSFSVWAGVDLDLAALGHHVGRVVYSPTEDLTALAGEDPERCCLWMTFSTLDDPSLAPPGRHTVSLQASLPYEAFDTWGTEGSAAADSDGYRFLPAYLALKEDVARRVVASAERIVPGLAASIVARDVFTPLTVRRYTRNSLGSGQGWLQTPGRLLAGGPASYVTPVRGLYRCGHWVDLGGLPSVIQSGRSAARVVLAREEGW